MMVLNSNRTRYADMILKIDGIVIGRVESIQTSIGDRSLSCVYELDMDIDPAKYTPSKLTGTIQIVALRWHDPQKDHDTR